MIAAIYDYLPSMRLFAIPLICLFAGPVGASDLVGSTVPPYPDGWSGDMGSCISVGDDLCAYSMTLLTNGTQTEDKIAALQMVELIDGKPVWKVVDIHDAPETTEEQIWAFEECHVNGDMDPTVIGLVTVKDMGGWHETDKTIWAIKFDINTQKLVLPELLQVECLLPGS